MKVTPTELLDILIAEPKVFEDSRGCFFEVYNRKHWAELGLNVDFVQDNQSASKRHVLRGLHYQVQQSQGKLVRAIQGEIFDVAVDLRRSSKTFGRSACIRISAQNRKMLWIPPGFAHGFMVLSETAEVLYKTTDFYAPEFERTLLWKDPQLRIPWPSEAEPILSEKDQRGLPLSEAELFD